MVDQIFLAVVLVAPSTFSNLKKSICACSEKIVDNCLPLVFRQQFFCPRVPDIISKPKNKKTASRNKMLIKFYITQWTVEDDRTKTMVTPFQKNARHFFMYSPDQYKKRAKRGSVMWGTCVIPDQKQIFTQM